MTPEKARELLEAATPGPWERHPDKPWALCNLERKFAVHMELVKDRGLDPHPEDVANTELIAAVPALAELVAGLRYEYDYEVLLDDGWVPMGYEFASLEDVRERVAGRRRGTPARIVRRLVSEPEVAE